MKAMKIKTIVAIVIVAIFISSSIAVASQSSPIDDGKPAPVEVKLEVRELFRGWYLIWTTVKNLEDERITLSTGRPAGGIYIRSWWYPYEYQKPEYTTMIMVSFSLRPHQEKILYFGLWNINWASPSPPQYFSIFGYLCNYTYNGETYPRIGDGPYFISAT